MVELGFWETLVIVIFPIIVGAISTHFLSRGWQNYQHKLTLKQELIVLYNESIFSLKSAQTGLVNEILDSVTSTIEINEEKLKKLRVEGRLQFPDNPKEKIEDQFIEQYRELNRLAIKIGSKRSLLSIRLRLYTNDETMVSELGNLVRINIRHRTEIKNLILAKTKEEFLSVVDKINEIKDKYRSDFQNFQEKLIKLKIKKITV